MKNYRKNSVANALMFVIRQKRSELNSLPVRAMLSDRMRHASLIRIAQRYNNIVFA